MYAVRKVYVKQWDHDKPEERYTVQISKGGKPVPGIQPDRISEIEEQVMYWRKANHIHAWIVENVQDDADNRGSYYVDWEILRVLLSICKEVIKVSKLVEGTVYAGTVYSQENPKGLVQRTAGKVIEDATIAKKLLPRSSGFFFGSQEYDADYLQDVKDTRDWVAQMFEDQKNGVPGDIYYSASW